MTDPAAADPETLQNSRTQPMKRVAVKGPSSFLSGRLEDLSCTAFDGGCDSQDLSPNARMPHKRFRCPPTQGPSEKMPALADLPRPLSAFCENAAELDKDVEGDICSVEPAFAVASVEENCLASSAAVVGDSSGSTSTGDWRMVLYHDRNVVMYNPRESPPFRSRRLSSLDEAQVDGSNTALASSYGRCPLCRQSIDSKFAFAAQAYFDLLQGLFRSSASSAATSTDPPEDVDVLEEADLYRILGVSRNAKLDDIKRAYRKRSLRYHPDKNLEDVDAKRKFQKVAEAFSVLSDEHKRAKYDKSGDMDLEDFDVEQFMEMVSATGLKYKRSPSVSLDVDIEDVLEAEAACGIAKANAGGNPFLVLHAPVELEAVVASEGGADAEAAAVAKLQNLPAGLLNTGYYNRFFSEAKKLGSGSWGSVFLCRHVLDDLILGDYAVKKVPVGDNKAWLRDMVREVKTFERLHHPNIVEYKHSWLELSRTSPFCPLVPFLFILMQYCNGGSLEELIWQEGQMSRPKVQLPTNHIWCLLMDVLRGLQHLHHQGILHRDMKPTNILLQWLDGNPGSGVPRALLSDFGTATPFGEAPAGVTTARGYTGTVAYTAPELLTGDDQAYTEKSDMWSLGIVLHAMCFSSLPWTHDNPSTLKALIRRFAEERSPPSQATRVAQASVNAIQSANDDIAAWLPSDNDGRLGPLRLVLAALLELDISRRPTATDLLDNPNFRRQAARFTRGAGEINEALSAVE